MYINEPILKGKRKYKKANIYDKSNTQPAQQIEKRTDESYFEQKMIEQVDGLMKNCQHTLNHTISQIQDMKDISTTQQEQSAFLYCVKLLQLNLQKEESHHRKVVAVVQKKIIQIQDYQTRIQNQFAQLKTQHHKILLVNKQGEEQINNYEKKLNRTQQMKEEIQQEKQKIHSLHTKLQQSKEKSKTQKDQFVQLQAQQFTLSAALTEEDEKIRKCEEETFYLNEFEKLRKLKRKIQNTTLQLSTSVEPHLQRKINKMAHIRTQIKHLTDGLHDIQLKIEDQNYIINGLKQKVYYLQNAQGQNIFAQYKNKYEELYFQKSPQSGNNEWDQYSQYLNSLMKRQRERQSRIVTQFQSYERSNSNHSEEENMKNSSSKKVTRQRFHKQKRGNKSTKEKNVIKLPKIIKIEDQQPKSENVKANIKQELKRQIINSQSQFEIVSHHSGQSKMSGSIIQVQFHKK